ncbi:MAG TPA: hypothetical protein VI431_11100 [Candidatus Acidoferrum sp.]
MKTQLKAAYCVAMVLLLMGSGRVLADDKPTSLADARNAVETNLRTPEGRAYDERLGKEFIEKHLATMKQCKPSDGKGLDSFWILMKLDKDGTVREVLLHPETKMGTCARETLLKSAFSPPPRPGYWVSVYMKLVH